MTDREPLLKKSAKLSYDADNDQDKRRKRRFSLNTFSGWRQWFFKQEDTVQVVNDPDGIDTNELVHVFELFRFSDRTDYILMIIVMCLLIVFVGGLTASQVVFGQLIGLFAQVSFTENCDLQHQTLDISKYKCPLGIELNSASSTRLLKLCHINNATLTSVSTPVPSSFRTQVMHPIRWLFIIGVIEFICGITLYVLWTISVKRQASCMSVRLFQSILQRIIAVEEMNVLNSYSKAGQIAEEVFSSLRTVHSLNGAKFEQKRYENELYPTTQSSIRQGSVFGIFAGWLSFGTYLVYAVGFMFGCVIMTNRNSQTMSFTDITIVVTVFAQSMALFSYIGPFLQSVSEARGAAVPIFRLIDAEDDAKINEPEIWEDDKSNKQLVGINADIKFDNVNFVYPSRKDMSILKNFNFTARTGQTTAIVGSSGCGKSTCLSLLLRYYEPSSGRILINGHPIQNYNLKQFRQTIGVVSQEPILFAASIFENIRFGKVTATQAEIEEAARQANAHNFIMELPNKYETLVGERGVQLSGGQKQRIALARALVKQPTILLLDEATSALDNASEKIVQEALDKAYQGRTTIVIAHRLSTIQNADHIYVVDKGSVIEEGTHETLMAKEGGKYQEMIKNQQIDKVTGDEHNTVGEAKVDEEIEQQTGERSRLLSDKQVSDTNEESSTSEDEHAVFLRLLSMNKPEWFSLLVGAIASIINGVSILLFAYLIAHTIHHFTDCDYNERRRKVFMFCLLLVLMGLLIWTFRYIQYTAFAISGSRLTERIRSKAFECLLRQEVAYFDRPENSTGAICARLFTDASAVQQMTGTRLGVICETLALICFGLLFGIFLSWQLTLIALFPFLLLIPAMYLNVRLEMWLDGMCSLIREQANMIAVEVINNMRTVKQLSAETELLNKYSDLIHQTDKLYQKYSLLSTIPYGLFWMLDAYTTAFLYWYALIRLEKNQFTIDHVIVIIAFVVFVMQAMRSIETMAQQIGSSLSAVTTFFNLFDRIPTIDNTSEEGEHLANFRGEIEFDQVQFAYPTRPTVTVLNKFQLKIKSGQRVAFVGASGCGKSTTIHLLERFYDVGLGQLLLDGTDIRQLSIHWIRSQLGLVGQEPVLFNLTIAQNIAYGLENIPEDDIIRAAMKANIHDFIQRLPLRYETKVGMKGSFLSGGEKQRIAIARVLLRRPKILLLDEATSALDSYNEQVVQQALEKAQTEDPNRTSLIIAHRLSTIQSCDLICVIDNGHIIESGTHTELIQQRGAYYAMLPKDNL
ncbi:unnamed protein product [Adineta steineri]|uniref:Uncharacterized protein n=1 Tax=Adineta steineri TaxID=433720 RepID=A0A816BQ15_9BILA|nr:unnamed protein product [Adineta steineri]CAF1611965.1 unnamed protein product [Adineta steineri]